MKHQAKKVSREHKRGGQTTLTSKPTGAAIMARAVQKPLLRPSNSVSRPMTAGPRLLRAATKNAGMKAARSAAPHMMALWSWKTTAFHIGRDFPAKSAKLNRVNRAIGYLQAHTCHAAARAVSTQHQIDRFNLCQGCLNSKRLACCPRCTNSLCHCIQCWQRRGSLCPGQG